MAFVREKVTKNRTYYYLVANHRVDGKVLQDTLYLGIKRPFKEGSQDEKEYLDCFQSGGSFVIKLCFPEGSKKWREMLELTEVEVLKQSGGCGWWLHECWKDIQEREEKLKLKRASKQRCAGARKS